MGSSVGTPTRRRLQRPLELLLLFTLALGAAVYASTHWSRVSVGRADSVKPAFPIANRADANTVPLRWRSTELGPARSAGHICVTDAHHGKICATFVAGERPADALTREIERRGWHVQSFRAP